jgi:F-box domain
MWDALSSPYKLHLRDTLVEKIFGHLPPSDLLTLSRVNQNFRNLLSGAGSSSLWNTSFRLVGAPMAPRDMSLSAWARLLFGGSYCYVRNFTSTDPLPRLTGRVQSCGAKPVTRILFSLRRRACKVCMTAQ